MGGMLVGEYIGSTPRCQQGFLHTPYAAHARTTINISKSKRYASASFIKSTRKVAKSRETATNSRSGGGAEGSTLPRTARYPPAPETASARKYRDCYTCHGGRCGAASGARRPAPETPTSGDRCSLGGPHEVMRRAPKAKNPPPEVACLRMGS